MRAVRVRQHGGPDALEVVETPDPVPGPNDLLVETAFAGVNYIDIYQRSGQLPTSPPFVAGLEGAGRVVQLGQDADGFEIGDRVAWATAAGSYATHVIVPTAKAVRVPDDVSLRLAAAAMLQGITGHYLTETVHRGEPGQFAVVHAAAGGMGLVLCQLLSKKGLTVIGTASTADKANLALAAGATHVIRYDETDFASAVKELTGGIGADVVYDSVGASTFEGSLASLRPRGYLTLFGASSGNVPPFDLQRLAAMGSLVLSRPTIAHFIATPEENRWRGETVLSWVRDGHLDFRIGGEYELSDAASAHADLAARRTTGKLILRIRED